VEKSDLNTTTLTSKQSTLFSALPFRSSCTSSHQCLQASHYTHSLRLSNIKLLLSYLFALHLAMPATAAHTVWNSLSPALYIESICSSLQTENHTSRSSLNFYRPHAQPTVSKQRRQRNNQRELPKRKYWQQRRRLS